MNVNADFTLKAVMDTHALTWEPSPMAGVDRQALDSVGDEVARASSLVRYAAGSGYSAHTHGGGEEILVLDGIFSDEHALVRWAPNTQFNPHVHPGGEEILVLQGVFHDEHGTYPQGTWIRSPRYSRHAPFTQSEGALIYVKTGHLDDPLTD